MESTRSLVDPELAGLLHLLPEFTVSTENLAMIRQAPTPPVVVPDGLVVEETLVPGFDGGPEVRVLITRPDGAGTGPLPVLVWIHGGGYVLGSAEGDQPFLFDGIAAAGCATVSVDYRLAPETPHPGPLHDCYAALLWVHRNAAELWFDPARIAIGGESAGGGLAAALALLARDRAEVPLVYQALIYPMLDDRTVTSASPNAYTGEFVWNRESNRFGWRSLLGREPGGADVPVHAAAGRCTDASGLPPTFISSGGLDLFLDEDLAYGSLLLRSGVPTTVRITAGAFHGFVHIPSTATREHNAAMWALLRGAFSSSLTDER